MAALHVLVSVLLVFFLSIASTKDLPLTPFAKSLKSALPKATYDKLFGFKVKDTSQFVEAVAGYLDTFAKTLGQKTPPEVSKDFDVQAKRIAKLLNPGIVFAKFSNSVGNTLKDQKKLTSENQDKLAKKLAEQLKKTADLVKTDDVVGICNALAKTNAEFMKSLGLSSQNVLINYDKNLLAEDKEI